MTNKKRRNNNKHAQYYMYGNHAVLAAANNKDRKIKQIFCLEKQEKNIKKKLSHLNLNITIVQNDFIIDKIGRDQPHQGVIALVDTIFKNNIEELNFSPKKNRVVILDQLSDPQNIGAIIRSAAAFGFDKIIIPSDNSPDENAIIAKAACGCLELVQIAKVTNIKKSIDKLKKLGFWVSGLEAKGKDKIEDIITIDKLAIIIGSEDKGMRKLTTENCDFLVKIPISEKVESLNASNAAAIMFYSLQI